MDAIRIETPYARRSVTFLGLWEAWDWKIKVYGISARGERPPRDLVGVAKDMALRELPRPAVTDTRHGAGLLIVHEGADGEHVVVGWWVNEVVLKCHLFDGPSGCRSTETFRYLTPSGLMGSTWEIALFAFERDAWVNSVVAREGGPDLDEYLLQRFTGKV